MTATNLHRDNYSVCVWCVYAYTHGKIKNVDSESYPQENIKEKTMQLKLEIESIF